MKMYMDGPPKRPPSWSEFKKDYRIRLTSPMRVHFLLFSRRHYRASVIAELMLSPPDPDEWETGLDDGQWFMSHVEVVVEPNWFDRVILRQTMKERVQRARRKCAGYIRRKYINLVKDYYLKAQLWDDMQPVMLSPGLVGTR